MLRWLGETVRWVCEACGHHNSIRRMTCRRCRTFRPLGS